MRDLSPLCRDCAESNRKHRDSHGTDCRAAAGGEAAGVPENSRSDGAHGCQRGRTQQQGDADRDTEGCPQRSGYNRHLRKSSKPALRVQGKDIKPFFPPVGHVNGLPAGIYTKLY